MVSGNPGVPPLGAGEKDDDTEMLLAPPAPDNLIMACRKGELAMVKRILANYDDINEANESGWTAIHAACWDGHTEVISLLVESGADIRKATSIVFREGNLNVTPMELCNYCEHWKLMEHLHKEYDIPLPTEDAPPTEMRKRRNMRSPYRSRHGDDERDLMMRRDTEEFDGSGKEGFEDVIQACLDGNLELVKALAEKFGTEILTSEGWSPLLAACKGKSLELVQYLVALGADMERADNDGVTPFHVACRFGNVETVMYLHEQGVDKVRPDDGGHTPLSMACYFGRLEIVEYLVTEAEMSVSQVPQNGMDPMMAACLGNELAMVKFLSEQGIDTEEPERAAMWLVQVCYKGHLDILKYFHEERGVDLDIVNSKGQTMLAAACHDNRL